MTEQRKGGGKAKTRSKRAITLAGGGPAAGLSVGALQRLHGEPDINFDVWSSACVGAWTMIAYHTARPGHELDDTFAFYRHVFRPDDWYARFPIATVFTPDWMRMAQNTVAFVTDPRNYRNLVVPDQIWHAMEAVARFMTDPTQWGPGGFNYLMLNSVLAPNPVVKFWTSLMYESGTRGLSHVYYPDSPLLSKLDFDRLYQEDKPVLYHNAYNLTRKRMELFSNRYARLNDQLGRHYRPISAKSLVACSALPYVEEPITIDDEVFCEGAVIDTVNFEHLMADHPDLDEIWVSRILDTEQVKTPANLYDALNNLVMLFAATTSEDDVKLFKHRVKERGWNVKVIDIPVSAKTCFDWTYSNFDRSVTNSYWATDHVIDRYRGGQSNDLEGILEPAIAVE